MHHTFRSALKSTLSRQATYLIALAASVVVPAVKANSLVVYSGIDGNVTVGSPLPNSDAAAASFDAAAGGMGNLIVNNLEGAALGNFTTEDLGLGVGVTLGNTNPASGIRNDPSQPFFGFNTTPGGANFLMVGTNAIAPGSFTQATATFNFTNPIDAFGAYFTGLAGGGDIVVLKFTDGTSWSTGLSDTAACNPSCATFFGFTDSGKAISSIELDLNFLNMTTFNEFYDIGVDDLHYSAVPEPSSYFALTVLLAGLVWRVRSKARLRVEPNSNA